MSHVSESNWAREKQRDRQVKRVAISPTNGFVVAERRFERVPTQMVFFLEPEVQASLSDGGDASVRIEGGERKQLPKVRREID